LCAVETGIVLESRPTESVVPLWLGGRVGVDEFIARQGRTEEEPICQVGGVLDAEGTSEGVCEGEGNIGPAQTRDIGQL